MRKILAIALALLIGLISCVSTPTTSSPTQMPQELIGKWDMFVISEDAGQTNLGVNMPFEIFNDRIFFIDSNTYGLVSKTYNLDKKYFEITYSDGEKWILKVSVYQGVKVIGVIVIDPSGADTGVRFAAKPPGSADFDFQRNLYRPGPKLNTTNL